MEFDNKNNTLIYEKKKLEEKIKENEQKEKDIKEELDIKTSQIDKFINEIDQKNKLINDLKMNFNQNQDEKIDKYKNDIKILVSVSLVFTFIINCN